jgi:hypothetical protein
MLRAQFGFFKSKQGYGIAHTAIPLRHAFALN